VYEPEPVGSFVEYVGGESWNVFKQDAVLYILASLAVTVGSIVSLGLLSGPLTVGFLNIVHKRQRGEEASVGDIASGFDKFVPSFLAMIIIGVCVVLGSCLIVAGLIFAFFAAFTFHAVAFEDAPAVDAIKRSFVVVKDNLVNTIALLLGIAVLSAVGSMVIIGFIVTSPLGMVATVIAWQRITQPRAQALGVPGSPAPY
jgi:uncharacterized membrane protein